jgi:ribonuclease HI
MLAPAGTGTDGAPLPPHRKEINAGYRLTTNNRMELLAVIVGLETLKGDGHEVTVYSDSRYVVDAVEKKWVFGWEKKGFAGKKNPDLWARFLRVYRRHRVHFVWVKGHASNPENNRCDELATAAADGSRHLEDVGYNPE